jgi:hypothetical protein
MKDEEVEVDSETVEAKEFTVFRKGMLTCKNNSFKDWIRKTRPKRNPVLSAVVDIFKMNRGIVNMRVQNQKAMDIVLNCTQSVLDAEVAVAKAKGETVGSVVLLALGCPCGRTYNYKTVQDVPKKTTMCPCGAAVIEYALEHPVGIEPPAALIIGMRAQPFKGPLPATPQPERVDRKAEAELNDAELMFPPKVVIPRYKREFKRCNRLGLSKPEACIIKWKGRFPDPKETLKDFIKRKIKNGKSNNDIISEATRFSPSGYTQSNLERRIRSSVSSIRAYLRSIHQDQTVYVGGKKKSIPIFIDTPRRKRVRR